MTIYRGRDPYTGDLLGIETNDGIISTISRQHSGATDVPWISPGLIDLQVNGFRGRDVNAPDCSVEMILGITDDLAREGTTVWVPTIVSAAEERIHRALQVIASARAADPRAARSIPFAHVEGPFISELDGPRGVHDREQIRPIDAQEVARWRESGPVGYVTVSPHTADAPAQISRIVRSGTAVAIGHTHATAEQILAAVDAGASLSTHLGNGIFTELPRHPNPIWSQLADDRLSCGFIADGHHLPADTLTAMLRAKGPGRAFLVSDAVELAGSEPGHYRTAVGGTVELTSEGRMSYVGTNLLAGSAASLADCVAFAWRHTPLGRSAVLELATRNPGTVIRRLGGPPMGTLQVGAPADLIELDDSGSLVGVIQDGVRLR